MSEKKFGETPRYGTRTLKEEIRDEREREGYAYAGDKYLAENDLKDGNYQEALTKLENKYKEIKDVEEVKLMINPRDNTEVWVFLKYK